MNKIESASFRDLSRPASAAITSFLAILIFSAYMTETKFIPEIKHNVGAFEVASLLFAPVAIAYILSRGIKLKFHPLTMLIGVITFVAAFSVFQIPESRQFNGFINVVILVFMFLFTFVLFNFVRVNQRHFYLLLRFIGYSSFIVSLWVIADGIGTGGSINAAGPFRNRAHAGIYMLTSSWIILMNICWPKTSWKTKLLFYVALATSFYCVAVAGRRSVYVAFTFGVIVLTMSSVFLFGKFRTQMLTPIAIALTLLGYLAATRGDEWNPLNFFKTRVAMVAPKLQKAVGYDEDEDQILDESFFTMQRHAAIEAWKDHPIFGIGWGGFYLSTYSPTGHELHTTPFRFLAELGSVGFILYLCFLYRLFWGALKTALASRKTDYQLVALVLAVAIASSFISSIYNRQVTERTFWLLLVVFMSFESFVLRMKAPVAAPPVRRKPVRTLRPVHARTKIQTNP